MQQGFIYLVRCIYGHSYFVRIVSCKSGSILLETGKCVMPVIADANARYAMDRHFPDAQHIWVNSWTNAEVLTGGR